MLSLICLRFFGGISLATVLAQGNTHDLTVTTEDENIKFFLVAAGFSLRKLKLAATYKTLFI